MIIFALAAAMFFGRAARLGVTPASMSVLKGALLIKGHFLFKVRRLLKEMG